jgi:hypothetical protein
MRMIDVGGRRGCPSLRTGLAIEGKTVSDSVPAVGAGPLEALAYLTALLFSSGTTTNRALR